MNIYEDFGARLEVERKRLKLKQAQMAEAAGVSLGAYSNYIRCASAPDVRALRAWADVGVDVLYVVTGQHVPSLLSAEEGVVVAGYRELDARGRAGVLALIGGLSGDTTDAQPIKAGKRSQVIVGGSNNVQVRSYVKEKKANPK
ncbi:hypothetical protein R16034_02981 [Ralstonia edaphis]|uniref:HTH cro/C1-type domain-containing protein n=1 Tax=Ralstonia edaphi TaxID=3058599 RepID=A0AB72X1R6_9RALS|nr:helix-turn-helix transcriptional regulator [Ralstonia sp. LMG 6871]CAJ0742123.1 hypothetical protein R16034_02981 [Ralstonia sp. LMG 6871]